MAVDPRGLTELALFRDLSSEELATVAGHLETVDVEPGAVLFKQGAWAASMYVVAEGVIEVVAESESEGDRLLATLTSGACLGEMALVRDQERSKGARAGRKGARLWMLKKDQLKQLAATHPRLWGQLFKNVGAILADRVESMDRELGRLKAADGEKGGGLLSRLWGG